MPRPRQPAPPLRQLAQPPQHTPRRRPPCRKSRPSGRRTHSGAALGPSRRAPQRSGIVLGASWLVCSCARSGTQRDAMLRAGTGPTFGGVRPCACAEPSPACVALCARVAPHRTAATQTSSRMASTKSPRVATPAVKRRPATAAGKRGRTRRAPKLALKPIAEVKTPLRVNFTRRATVTSVATAPWLGVLCGVQHARAFVLCVHRRQSTTPIHTHHYHTHPRRPPCTLPWHLRDPRRQMASQ